jgi:26S proteasome regulatory subunit N2
VKFRQYLRKLIGRKRNDLEVFGLCLAYGIMNAGGRNVVVSCNSLRGENSATATVGLALFCNYFYWNPLVMMLPLAFHPTAVIGLDRNLELPSWEILSKGNRKMFANPPPFDAEKEPLKLRTAVLSITEQKKDLEKKVDGPKEEDDEEWSTLENPSRVTLNQIAGIDLNYSETYRPVTGQVFHGFVMLKELEPPEEDEEETEE